MKFESIRIANFKGFRDSGVVTFCPGFNIIVGQNNSGKTSLITALQMSNTSNDAYREVGVEEFQAPPHSILTARITLTKVDLVKGVLNSGSLFVHHEQNNGVRVASILNEYLIDVFEYEANIGSGIYNFLVSPIGPFPTNEISQSIKYSRERSEFFSSDVSHVALGAYANIFKNIEHSSIFLLNSQRFNIGRSPTSAPHTLKQDASNLPSALNFLQGSHSTKFRKLVANMVKIFPNIGNITVTPVVGTDQIEILIWPFSTSESPNEATPLDRSGTGISQALAILFIAQQEDEKIIIIDEISSFLHPMAIKSLIRILRTDYYAHQYIISTHYTDVIAWSEPGSIILTQKSNNACVAKNISLDEVADFQMIAGELGISMSDVFGSDRIIWVEGETEELCFPLLLDSLGKKLPRGTNLSKLVSTGNLSLRSRSFQMAFEIYEKASRMASPLTRPCIFTIDREGMSDADVQRLINIADGNLLVLDRRCYENYLISPEAIAAVLNEREPRDWLDEVTSWLNQNAGEAQYGAPNEWDHDLNNPVWLKKVDGAKLLEDLFPRITEERFRYQKTHHSLELTRILLTQKTAHLAGVLAFVEEIHMHATAE